MKTNSTSANVSEWKTAFTGKTIAIATALVMVLSFGALGAYGAGGGAENEAGTLTTDDPSAVLVNVNAPEANFEIASQVLPGEATGLFVPVGQDFVFTVSPIDNYKIVDVNVNGMSLGNDEGIYTVAGADVRDTLTVTVTAEALEAPAAEANPAPAADSPTPVVLAVEDMTCTFDGLPHAPILQVLDEAGNLIDGWFALGDVPAYTDVTDGAQEVVCNSATVFDADGNDITAQCAITFQPGSITITPAVIKITTPSAEKVYDGSALTAADDTLLEPPLLGEDEFNRFVAVLGSFAVTGSQTEIGESVNGYTIDWSGVNQNNYIVEENLGTLTVHPNEAPIVISAPTLTQSYTGQPLVAEKADYAAPDGFRVEATVAGSQTDVGKSVSTVESYHIYDTDGNEITDTFTDIQVQTGELTVTPARLEVVTPSATKQYDGQPLTATDGDWIAGFVNGETATATITGSQTEVGKSDNTYTIEWNGTAKESNYKINESLGKLEVLRIDPGTTPSAEGNNTPAGTTGGTTAGTTGGTTAGTTAGTTGGATGGTVGTATNATGATPLAGTPGVNYLSQSTTPAEGGTSAPAGGEAASPVDAVAEGMQNVARGVIGEDPIPLTAPSTTELAEDGTPLGAFDAPVNNWLRWYVVVGILGTALYGAAVLARRRNFTRGLENQENVLMGEADPEAADAAVPAAQAVRS